jgi:hypothetical protein
MLNLKYLLNSIDTNFEQLIKNKEIRLVRHTMKNRKDGDWTGFDNLLKFDNELLKIFTAEQIADKYKDAKLILVFVATNSTRCLLRGAFWSRGLISYEAFCKEHNIKRFEDYKLQKEIPLLSENEGCYYDLYECTELSPYKNRLVIDWGSSTVQWVQTQTDKEIWQILPVGFVSEFPGWNQVFISHRELKAIIDNPEGNLDWQLFLNSHDGVYVILDTSTSKNYVGSAYGCNGIWGRWSGYAKTNDNGNQALVELTNLNPSHADNFMYSIHHVFPKGSLTEREILDYESLLKNKIGSRSINGLNRN